MLISDVYNDKMNNLMVVTQRAFNSLNKVTVTNFVETLSMLGFTRMMFYTIYMYIGFLILALL